MDVFGESGNNKERWMGYEKKKMARNSVERIVLCKSWSSEEQMPRIN